MKSVYDIGGMPDRDKSKYDAIDNAHGIVNKPCIQTVVTK
jgi:hypothetical protein